ncbi:MAG: hypothetical protein JNJ50_05095 [Acidobacteria bacterium]|nr:hypothetical protein [Acidobacteriota bacterium]
MTDKLPQVKRTEDMHQIKNQELKPEILVRRLMRALGFCFCRSLIPPFLIFRKPNRSDARNLVKFDLRVRLA